MLMDHEYPGNVRELENIIEHAFVLCSSGLIQVRHLPSSLREEEASSSPTSRGGLALRDLEAAHIAESLQRHGGNRRAAAQELGIHPSTLFRKMKALGVTPPTKDGRSRGSG